MLTIYKTEQYKSKRDFLKWVKKAKERLHHHKTQTGVADPRPLFDKNILAVVDGCEYQFIAMTFEESQQKLAEERDKHEQEKLEQLKLAAQKTSSADYASFREQEYPIVGSQLDAIMKGFQSLAEQDYPLPKVTQEWIKHCVAVKTKFPKPN